MNDVTPSISEITAFENDLRQRTVRVFIYNKQVDNPLTKRLLSIANNEKIPVLGVTETLPLNRHYISWMVQQLTDLNQRLL
jgi:zinc/manganese transport system substrate-binding protein